MAIKPTSLFAVVVEMLVEDEKTLFDTGEALETVEPVALINLNEVDPAVLE